MFILYVVYVFRLTVAQQASSPRVFNIGILTSSQKEFSSIQIVPEDTGPVICLPREGVNGTL